MKKLTAALLMILMFAFPGVRLFADDEAPAEKTLFERLGGQPAVEAVIGEFVARAAADPKVNFIRTGQPRTFDPTPENLEKLKKHLVQFVSVATGAQDVVYEGQDMKTAHEGMKITNAEFDAIAADLIGALDKFNVPEKEKSELMAIVGTTRGQIVEEKS